MLARRRFEAICLRLASHAHPLACHSDTGFLQLPAEDFGEKKGFLGVVSIYAGLAGKNLPTPREIYIQAAA